MGNNLKHKKEDINLMDSIYLLIRDKRPIETNELYTLFTSIYKNFNIDKSSFEAIINQMCIDQIILKNNEEKLFPNPAKFTFQSYQSNYLVDKREERINSRFNKLVLVIPIALSLIFGILSCLISLYTLKLTKETNGINPKDISYKLVIYPSTNSSNKIKLNDTITIQKVSK